MTCTVRLARCVCRNFLGVGVSVREGYWRIGVRGLEGVCHQVGGANFTGMTQIKKTEMRNSLKGHFLSCSPSIWVFHSLKISLLFLTDAHCEPNCTDDGLCGGTVGRGI